MSINAKYMVGIGQARSEIIGRKDTGEVNKKGNYKQEKRKQVIRKAHI